MRLKPYFTITLSLTAMLLVGCSQQDTSLNAPEIASVSLAKGGDKGKPDGGGGAEEATFEVTFRGDVSDATGEPHIWTQKLSSGAKWIGTPYDVNPTLNLNSDLLGDCFESGPYTGPLQIREAKKNADHTAEAWFWFEADGNDDPTTTDIVYLLKMFGTFEDGVPWLPTVGKSNKLTLDAWEMGIEGNKFKDVACTGGELFDNPTTVKVERL